MKFTHWKKPLIALAATVAAAIPAILVDPSFAHYVAQHPWVATYLPLVIAGIHAFEKKNKALKVAGKYNPTSGSS